MDSVKLDNEYKINASASNSTSMLAQYIEMSRGAVQEFRRQRQLLGLSPIAFVVVSIRWS